MRRCSTSGLMPADQVKVNKWIQLQNYTDAVQARWGQSFSAPSADLLHTRTACRAQAHSMDSGPQCSGSSPASQTTGAGSDVGAKMLTSLPAEDTGVQKSVRWQSSVQRFALLRLIQV